MSKKPSAMAVVAMVLALLGGVGCDLLGGGGGDDARDGSGVYPSGFVTDGLFEVDPDVTECMPGTLSADFRDRMLTRLNALRGWHGLPHLTWSPDAEAEAQAAALSIVANGGTNHHLSAGTPCYSSDAAVGAEASLLLMSAGNVVGDIQDPDRYLAEWMRDDGVANLGHRRWLLDPFVQTVAFGFVHGEPHVELPYRPVIGAALHITANEDTSLLEPVDYVAYPVGDYPSHYFSTDGLLSFSAVASMESRSANGGKVFVEIAQVTVVDEDGAVLPVTDVERVSAREGAGNVIGLPNVLYWRVNGLREGVRYTVSIVDVDVSGMWTDFEYDFTLQ